MNHKTQIHNNYRVHRMNFLPAPLLSTALRRRGGPASLVRLGRHSNYSEGGAGRGARCRGLLAAERGRSRPEEGRGVDAKVL